MNYASMDWEAELQRVTLAFDVAGLCEIRHDREEVYFQGTGHAIESRGEFRLKSGFIASVSYEPECISFSISEMADDGTSNHTVAALIFWDGSRSRCRSHGLLSNPYELKNQLAKSLFYLDLLTIDVETVLEVSVSAHQKLEWQIEFEARTNR